VPGRLNEALEAQNDRTVYAHRLADEGTYTTRDGTVYVSEMAEKVTALQKQVTTLEKKWIPWKAGRKTEQQETS
jgi:hypothetical protein